MKSVATTSWFTNSSKRTRMKRLTTWTTSPAQTFPTTRCTFSRTSIQPSYRGLASSLVLPFRPSGIGVQIRWEQPFACKPISIHSSWTNYGHFYRKVIVQRTLAAKTMTHAKGGCIMASFLKILPLFIIIFPGMASRVLYTDTVACADPVACEKICGSQAGCTNIAYAELVINLLPQGNAIKRQLFASIRL